MIGSGEESEEQSYDICRAYGLLLNASAVTAKPLHEEISTQVRSHCILWLEVPACLVLRTSVHRYSCMHIHRNLIAAKILVMLSN